MSNPPWLSEDGTWIDPGKARTYQEWVQANSAMECKACTGRGWVWQEDASGMPTTQVQCPYCQGWRNQGWVVNRRDERFDMWRKRRTKVLIAGAALLVFGGVLPVLLYLGGLLACIIAFFVCHANRRPKDQPAAQPWNPEVGPPGQMPNAAPRHAPGFTDQRERDALGIFAVGLGVRSMLTNLLKGKF